MAGMQLAQRHVARWTTTTAISEIVGFADQFDANNDGSERFGKSRPVSSEHDRAHELSHKGRHGVPYEASIDWRGDGIVIEQLATTNRPARK